MAVLLEAPSSAHIWNCSFSHLPHLIRTMFLVFVFVSAGYPCLSEPSVLHDTCHSGMFIRLHAASVHAAQLHRLHIWTSHGQRHGETQRELLNALWSPTLMFSMSLFYQVKTGFVMNILGILSVSLAMNTWGVAMFGLHSYPDWAHPLNKSAVVPDVHFPSTQLLNATVWSVHTSYVSTNKVSEDSRAGTKVCF